MKTRKKVIWGIIGVVALALIVLAVSWGRQYYQNRYVGSDYYTMIPTDYDVTPVTMHALGGEDMGLGVEFNLTAYSADGTAKQVEFTVYDPSSDFNHGESIPQPGTYLLVKASNQLVTGWEEISVDKVPEGASGGLY